MSAPRVDGPGGVFPEPLDTLAAIRRATPYLVGTSSYEMKMGKRSEPQPTSENVFTNCSAAAAFYGNPRITDACVHFYDVHVRAKPMSYWDQPLKLLLSDLIFYGPTFRDADFMRKVGGKVFLYNFEYPKEGREEDAVEHAMDLAFIFGYPREFLPLTAEDKRMGAVYSKLFGNFVKYGEPTPPWAKIPTAGTWEPLRSPVGFNYYMINSTSSMEEFYHFDAVQFWNEVVPYL